MYHRHICAKETFAYVDHHIWKMLWKWARRRHPNKSRKWVKAKYFRIHKGRDWTFFAITEKNKEIKTVMSAQSVKIIRHPKIKANANPYTKEDETYFEKRIEINMLNKLEGKFMLRKLYDRQKGCCLICKQRITACTGWNAHHLTPKRLGGEWKLDNLVLLHPVCHIKVHHNETVAAALTLSVINA